MSGMAGSGGGSFTFLRVPWVTQSSWFESTGCFTVNVTRVVRKRNCCHLTPSEVLHLQTAGASYLDSSFATQLNWDLTVKPLLRQERFYFNLRQIGFSNFFFSLMNFQYFAIHFLTMNCGQHCSDHHIDKSLTCIFSFIYGNISPQFSSTPSFFSSVAAMTSVICGFFALCPNSSPLPTVTLQIPYGCHMVTKLQQTWWAS